jgi:tRNA-2-methylthio-N6-dimethylallyladenosine synthase
MQSKISLENNQKMIGKVVRVLIDSVSKKSEMDLCGRNDQNNIIVFPKEDFQIGDYADVLIERATGTTLIGKAVK